MSETEDTRGYPNGVADMKKHIATLQRELATVTANAHAEIVRLRTENAQIQSWKESVLAAAYRIRDRGLRGYMGMTFGELAFANDVKALLATLASQPAPNDIPDEREDPCHQDYIGELELKEGMCPHPATGRPDDFTSTQCIAAGECGCVLGMPAPKDDDLSIEEIIAKQRNASFGVSSRTGAHTPAPKDKDPLGDGVPLDKRTHQPKGGE